MFRKLLVGLVALGVLLSIPLTAAAATNTNQPGYWGDDCVKIETGFDGESWTADADYRLVVLKAATDNFEFYDVKLGDVLTTGNGRDISHIILCGEVPPSTTTTTTSVTTTTGATTTTTVTTLPPSTTTSAAPTTTVPGTTTTVTTGPPSSTTTTVPATTTTTPLVTTTTTTTPGPTTTSSTVPPTINIDVTIKCEQIDSSGTGAREPIVTDWSGTYTVGSTDEFEVFIVAYYGDGEPIGSFEIVGLTSKRQHENWFIGKPIDGRTITAEVWIDGVLVSSDTAVCGAVPETTVTVVTDPPPTTEPPPEEPILPVTGMEMAEIALLGLGLLGAGGLTMWRTREQSG